MFFEKLLADPEALKPIFHKDFTFTYMGKIPDTLVPYGVPYDSESLFTEWLAHVPKLLPFGMELKTTDIIADENGVACGKKEKRRENTDSTIMITHGFLSSRMVKFYPLRNSIATF